AYTCTVTATNAVGVSGPSAASGSVTPVAPASSYTLTGPSGGAVGSASTAFTVTPNAVYNGTITITPSGGGLSTPVVLTFSNSSVAQTFTITPASVGPVTLTPTNSGSLSNPSALSYNTPSGAPTIGTVTSGNGSVSVAFTAPGATGGSTITGYTATCDPGGHTGTGASSPITVSGLTNGSAYTCTVTATNAVGVSGPSAASGSVTPVAPANSFTLTGPSGGAVGSASTAFTVTPNAVYNGTITITPSGGGLSTPVVLTFSNSSVAQTFTITPASVGPVTLTPTNSGSLSNPSALSYNTPSGAPTIGTVTPGNGSVSVAFTAPGATGGSTITGYTATCDPGGHTGTGASSPITVSGLTNGTAYTCTVTATNAVGVSGPSAASGSVTPVAPANSFTLSGPSGGPIGTVSTAFTVTPNSVYSGTITITPSGGGLSAPIVLTFNGSTAQTFTITPASVGPVTLTPTNSGSLTNPGNLAYNTPPSAPPIGTATAGNGAITIDFTPPAATGGATITGYTATCNPGALTATGTSNPITVSGLTNGTAYTCSVTATNGVGTSAPSADSSQATPFTPANSYTLTGRAGGAIGAASSAFTVTPNAIYTGTITITASGGGLSTPVVLTFTHSSAAQTFTITPTAVGPVTLTPTNSGSLSNPAALVYKTPPGAPTMGAATPGNGSVTVSFTPPTANGGALVTGYTVSCTPGPFTATGAASPITVNGLTNGVAYSCTVTANNSAGSSEASSPSTAVTPYVPASTYTLTGPSGGPIGVQSGLFTVTPNALFVGSITITPYGGGVSAPIVLTYNKSAAPQSFTITPLSPGPVSLIGSNSGSLTNPAPLNYGTPPSAPVISSGTAGNGVISLQVIPPLSYGGGTIFNYLATCTPGGTGTSTGSSITIPGLTNGVAYTCSVVAVNEYGRSSPSAAFGPIVPMGPPSAPGNVIATAGNGQATVSFSPAASNGSAIVRYTVTVSPGGYTVTGTSSPISIMGLQNGTQYTFSVSATNGIGTGPSASSNAVTPIPNHPGAPASPTATAGNAQATVSFAAPADTGGGTITGYTVTSSPGGVTASGPSSPIVVNGLTNGVTYTFTVVAANAAGAGPASPPSNAVTPFGPPLAPLSPFATAGNGQATVSFSAPSNTGGSPILGYVVTSSPGGFTASGGASPITVTGLTNGTTYTFTVTASNAAGSGSPSAPSNAVTPFTVPSAPLNPLAVAGNGQATVSFSPPASDGGSPITGYTVTASPGGSTTAGSSSPITVSGLVNGTSYTFFVVASNRAGAGPPSQTSNSVTPSSGGATLTLLALSTFPIGVVGVDYPMQILTASGGVGPYTFSIIDGELPPGLTFASPEFWGTPTAAGDYSFTIQVTDAEGRKAVASGSIHINPDHADLILSHSTVDFAVSTGSANTPLPASVTVRSSKVETILGYTVTVSPPAPWLSVAGGGSTPGSIALSLSPTALTLQPGDPYETTVTASCASTGPCAGAVKTVHVALNVSAPAARLALTDNLVTFESTEGQPVTLNASARVQNTGGGTLEVRSIVAANSWVAATGIPSSLAAGPPTPFSVAVDTTGLLAGYHTSSITIASSAGTVVLPVALRVAPRATMRLAPEGDRYRTQSGAQAGNPNGSVLVSSNSVKPIAWSATVISGSEWLTLTSASGSAMAGAAGTVGYHVDTAPLSSRSPQTYYGTIRVSSKDTVEAWVDFQVVLEVLPGASSVAPEPSPAGMVLDARDTQAGLSRAVTVYASSTAPLPYQASASTEQGGSWLSVSPATGLASSAAPAGSTIVADPSGLAPGVYRGGVSYAFSSAAVRTVNVTLIVGANNASGQITTQAGCVPASIIATQVGLVHNFQQQAGWPTPLALKLVNDCGSPVTSAEVTAGFSNGDPPLAFTPVDSVSGIFAATWTPRGVSSQVTIDARASVAGLSPATVRIVGQVAANPPPILAENGALQIFAPTVGEPLAPGSAIQIYGTNLAPEIALAPNGTLPVILKGVSVWIGGLPAPLYYVSPNQIDAQIPFDLEPGRRYQIQVANPGGQSTAGWIQLVSVAPDIAATDAGFALAEHTDYRLISAGSPARPGETVILYLAGMGVTTPRVDSGVPSPAGGTAQPAVSPTLTVNGSPVTIDFAGLSPASVGLYQVNFRVPADAPAGLSKIVVTQGTQQSNAVYLPVQP
ncbi:MAG: fibronectin type III domain-containing protein, partial [Acidobacteria bacterium]|nr:fibronectin type III domain-containing protein [Acidobacteriota bacterium]